MTRQNLKYFLPRLPTLAQLHTLDLSCNFIDFRLNQDDLEQFCTVLSQLKHLKNLSLSGSPITNRLERILTCIDHSLDVLNLDFCSLSETDLLSLSQLSTHHQFVHLDLGTNRLNRFMRALVIALMKQPRLVVLDLDYNRFSSNDYLELIACCQRLPNLKCLSVRGPNTLTTQLAAATFIGEHYPRLRSWKIASPIEYSLNRFVGNDEQTYLIQNIMPYETFVNEMNKRAKCLVSIVELSVWRRIILLLVVFCNNRFYGWNLINRISSSFPIVRVVQRFAMIWSSVSVDLSDRSFHSNSIRCLFTKRKIIKLQLVVRNVH